jgi:hypothetical protein
MRTSSESLLIGAAVFALALGALADLQRSGSAGRQRERTDGHAQSVILTYRFLRRRGRRIYGPPSRLYAL